MVWEQARVSPSSFPQPRAGFCCIGLSEIGDTPTIAIYIMGRTMISHTIFQDFSLNFQTHMARCQLPFRLAEIGGVA